MPKNSLLIPRTGFGFDSHAFDRKGVLMLAGLPFRGTPALKAHSDGDVVIHAVIDALLGASSLDDIGELFPDSSPAWKGAAGKMLLQQTLRRLRSAGFKPLHVDVTVVADKPKLGAMKDRMACRLAELLNIPVEDVSVKAKTAEGLKLFRTAKGGMMAWAVATVLPC